MVVLRVIGGLLLAALVCGVAGVFKDYFHLWEADNLQYQWPIAMAASGALGALVMAFIKPSRIVPATAPPAALRQPAGQSQRPATTAIQAKPSGGATSSEVPGMPTFDFDKARGSIETAEQAGTPAPVQPKEQG
jgi:hypothetical protein